MEQEEKIEESVLTNNSISEDFCGPRLIVEKFTISPEDFKELRKLEVVRRFFLLDEALRSAVESNKDISSESIRSATRDAIKFIYETAVDINEKSKRYQVPGIGTSIKEAIDDFSKVEPVFNIKNFDDLKKTMEMTNGFCTRFRDIWLKVILNELKEMSDDFYRAFARAIFISQRGYLDYKWISIKKLCNWDGKKPSEILEEFFKSISLIKTGHRIYKDESSLESELFLEYEKQGEQEGEPVIRIKLDEVQKQRLYLFYQLKVLIHIFWDKKRGGEFKFDDMLDVLESTTEALYTFFKDGFFNSAVGLFLGKSLLRSSMALNLFIDMRYFANQRVNKVAKLMLGCLKRFRSKVEKNPQSTEDQSILVEEICDIIPSVIDFKKALPKRHNKESEEFKKLIHRNKESEELKNLIDSLGPKYTAIKSNLDSVSQDESKSMWLNVIFWFKKLEQEEEEIKKEIDSYGPELSSKFRNKISEFKMNLSRFVIHRKNFKKLYELEVVREFFDDTCYYVSNKSIRERIKLATKRAIMHIYNLAINIDCRYKRSINCSDKKTKTFYIKGYKEFNIETEIKSICNYLDAFVLVFDINDFYDLMKTLRKINLLHLRALHLWARVVLATFRCLASDFCDALLGAVSVMESGCPDFKFAVRPTDIVGQFREDISIIEERPGDTYGTQIFLKGELFLRFRNNKSIKLGEWHNRYLRQFYSLKEVITVNYCETFKNYYEFGKVSMSPELFLKKIFMIFSHTNFDSAQSDFFNNLVFINLSLSFIKGMQSDEVQSDVLNNPVFINLSLSFTESTQSDDVQPDDAQSDLSPVCRKLIRFFISPVCVNLSRFFIKVSKILTILIDARYVYLLGDSSYFTEVAKLAYDCLDGFENEVNKLVYDETKNKSNSCTPMKSLYKFVLMKSVYEFVFKTIKFREELDKLRYPSEEFMNVVNSFELECKNIKSSFGSVREDEKRLCN